MKRSGLSPCPRCASRDVHQVRPLFDPAAHQVVCLACGFESATAVDAGRQRRSWNHLSAIGARMRAQPAAPVQQMLFVPSAAVRSSAGRTVPSSGATSRHRGGVE